MAKISFGVNELELVDISNPCVYPLMSQSKAPIQQFKNLRAKMEFSNLIDFIDYRMKMAHIIERNLDLWGYRPLDLDTAVAIKDKFPCSFSSNTPEEW